MYNLFFRYRFSIIVFFFICYLSFFKPPSTGLPSIPHLDKIVHFGMYFGFSSIIWFELLRDKKITQPKKGWVYAFAIPCVISGVIELLQEYCTSYRGGEWLDLAANSLGALAASLLFYYVLRKHFLE